MGSLHSHQLSVRCHSPQPMGLFSLRRQRRCVPPSCSSKSLPARPPSCFLCQSPDSSISHVTTVDLQASVTRSIMISCGSGRPFTHAFMQFYFAQLQLQKTQYLQLGQNRGQYYGGSLPNVNQIGNGNIDLPFQVSP